VNPQGRTVVARAAPWLAGFVVWTALACLLSAETAIWLRYRGDPIDWKSLLAFRIADWYSCGVFLPLFVYATRRWPLDRRHLALRLPLHTVLVVGSSVAKIALFRPVKDLLGRPDDVPLSQAVARGIISEMLAFCAVAAALHAFEFYRRYRERETLTAQLQARLSDAQLRALRAQLNPHFLFNTLNAVTTLLHRDPDRADAMLTRLGELLRFTLRADPAHEIPLHEEIAVLDRYLSIMRMRFSDRVTVHCDVDARAATSLVPSFILQPIVENAFEHGIAKLKRPGEVHIEARMADASLVLTVRDDGPGPRSADHAGVGLTNTRRRLAELYGTRGSLQMLAPAGGGTIVELRMPFRAAMTAGA
jgi:two-component system, LytTR family, sensor kinase